MTEAVEVAIEYALLERATAFANAQSPAIPISLPNIDFAPPTPNKTGKWLRATFLPADTVTLGLGFNDRNQHLGLLQIDVMWGAGGGGIAPRRVAADIIAYFKRGTTVTKDNFAAQVCLAPFIGPAIRDEYWHMMPVHIPYLCLARNPA